ncbi:hypothetical protein ACH4Y0_05670 [Streptomyces sp. NPDC020707]|uniref:hypothetical protein n=1 Tax=Streptomyces sp. NPDC020707 TaxID=3365084 RepID=UPI0037B15E2F
MAVYVDFVETAFDDEKRRRPEVKGDYDERYEDERGETQITYKFEVLANGALRVWRTWEDGTDPVVDTVYGPTAWARVRGASMSV